MNAFLFPLVHSVAVTLYIMRVTALVGRARRAIKLPPAAGQHNRPTTFPIIDL